MFKYINLRNDENRQTAIEHVKVAEMMNVYTEEPICITKERAKRLIMDANWMLRELECLLEADKNSKPVFYNWLKKSEIRKHGFTFLIFSECMILHISVHSKK